MAEAKQVWIQNSYRSPLEFIIKDKNTNESERFVFGAYKVDRISNRVLEDGYTVLDEDVYNKLLKTSNSFRQLVEKGTLVKYDEAPLSALSDVERILTLQEEVRILREKNDELQAKLDKLEKEEKKSSGSKSSKTTKPEDSGDAAKADK